MFFFSTPKADIFLKPMLSIGIPLIFVAYNMVPQQHKANIAGIFFSGSSPMTTWGLSLEMDVGHSNNRTDMGVTCFTCFTPKKWAVSCGNWWSTVGSSTAPDVQTKPHKIALGKLWSDQLQDYMIPVPCWRCDPENDMEMAHRRRSESGCAWAPIHLY